MVLESKKTTLSALSALPQALTYLMANPNPDKPVFGMVTNGDDILFISFCREVWYVIPFDKTIIVCEKPKVLWKEHHLAYTNKQPDISFSDGYSI